MELDLKDREDHEQKNQGSTWWDLFGGSDLVCLSLQQKGLCELVIERPGSTGPQELQKRVDWARLELNWVDEREPP